METKTPSIHLKKDLNMLLKQSRIEGKKQNCSLCGDERSSFCNSHTIPSFIINYIADNGHVLIPHAFASNEILSDELGVFDWFDSIKGIGNTWTFHNICPKCDRSYFCDYENNEALQKPFTNRMMAEISLKNALLQLDKRASETHFYNKVQMRTDAFLNKEELETIQALDIKDWEFEKRRAKKIIDKDLKSGYKLLYWTRLQYTVPYAFQSGIPLEKDLHGWQINDIYDLSPNERMQFLQIVVFPLAGCSVISVFCHKDDRKYKTFEKEFAQLPEDDKLEFINYTALKYSENTCAAPKLSSVIKKHDRLRQLIAEVSESPRFGINTSKERMSYSPVKMEEVPNLLSKEYSIEKLEVSP